MHGRKVAALGVGAALASAAIVGATLALAGAGSAGTQTEIVVFGAEGTVHSPPLGEKPAGFTYAAPKAAMR